MTFLVIVESPTKAKTLSRFLGKDYIVKSSYGHIRDLPKSELGIDIEHNFAVKYVTPPKARKAIKELKESAKKSDQVILATDEDREGEAIAWHIAQTLKLGENYQRITFHEITEKAIKEALKEPGKIDMNLVNAQQARRSLDRLVGYKLSPFLWKKIVRGLSAGRVQSVAVRLIVDKEREIQSFKPEEYWSIEAELSPKSQDEESFIARLNKKDNKAVTKLAIKNQKQAESILSDLKGAKYQVKKIENTEKKRHPFPPFTTSTLQQEAAKKLGFSSKQTMVLAQQLYEGIKIGSRGLTGLITYHRTDSLNLSPQAVEQGRNFIKKELGEKYLTAQPKFYRTKSKGAQEAHEAIRPTDPNIKPDAVKSYLKGQQLKLYQLVWNRFIACQMKEAVLDATTVDIEAKNYNFRASGSTIKFDGFLKIYPTQLKESFLPPLKEKQPLELLDLTSQQHFTQPPSRYNEASLIKILEEHGIGRPSTYAPIVSTIQARGYVEKNEQKKFAPTEIGFMVTDLLKEHFPKIVDTRFTAQMEQELDKIAKSKKDWLNVIKDFFNPFQKNLLEKYETVERKKTEEPTDKICPKCQSPIIIKFGRFGKFYACSNFPECKHTEPIIKSTGVKCPECQKGEIAERKSKKGKIFYSCSKYPKCEYALWDEPTGDKCPECGSLMIKTKKEEVRCSNKECPGHNK